MDRQGLVATTASDDPAYNLIRTVSWSALRGGRHPVDLLSVTGERVGSLVRVDPRRRSLSLPVAGMFHYLQLQTYEIRDGDDRCVRRIIGPCPEHERQVVVRYDDGTELVRIGRERVGAFRREYPISSAGREIGRMTAFVRDIERSDGAHVARIRHRPWSIKRENYEIDAPNGLVEPFVSVAVVAAICRRSSDWAGLG